MLSIYAIARSPSLDCTYLANVLNHRRLLRTFVPYLPCVHPTCFAIGVAWRGRHRRTWRLARSHEHLLVVQLQRGRERELQVVLVQWKVVHRVEHNQILKKKKVSYPVWVCCKAMNLREDNKRGNELIKTILTIITTSIVTQ